MSVRIGNSPAPTTTSAVAAKPTAPAAVTSEPVPVPEPASAPESQDTVVLVQAGRCADFDPAAGICPDTRAAPGTREAVAAALAALRLPEPAIASTLTYLDQQQADYGEIGQLIQNQLSFKRDANDVLGAMQAYGVMLEGRALQIEGTETTQYQEVMTGLKDGRVRIDKDTERDMGTAAGHYRFDADTIDMHQDFRLDSVYQRSVMFHELIHTRQDVEHEKQSIYQKPLFGEAEKVAYKAQAAFLSKKGYKPEQAELKGHLILNPAMRMMQWSALEKYEASKTPPDQARLGKIHAKLQDLDEDLAYQIHTYYDTSDKTLTADGLHTHHH